RQRLPELAQLHAHALAVEDEERGAKLLDETANFGGLERSDESRPAHLAQLRAARRGYRYRHHFPPRCSPRAAVGRVWHPSARLRVPPARESAGSRPYPAYEGWYRDRARTSPGVSRH